MYESGLVSQILIWQTFRENWDRTQQEKMKSCTTEIKSFLLRDHLVEIFGVRGNYERKKNGCTDLQR